MVHSPYPVTIRFGRLAPCQLSAVFLLCLGPMIRQTVKPSLLGDARLLKLRTPFLQRPKYSRLIADSAMKLR
jgi:hypothetical protein